MSTALLVANQPTSQQLADYANAVALINNYAYAITNQGMPVLQFPPSNYATFTAQFAPAKQHALNWTDNIFVSMLQLPQTIDQQASNLFDLEGSMIQTYLGLLVGDPSNASAKAGLANALTSLQNVVQAQVATAEQISVSLTGFSSDIYNDAKILTGIAQAATADSGSDQQRIQQINADIANLNSEIASAQFLLTVSEIGIGLSIFVGIVGAVLCFIRARKVSGPGRSSWPSAGSPGPSPGRSSRRSRSRRCKGRSIPSSSRSAAWARTSSC